MTKKDETELKNLISDIRGDGSPKTRSKSSSRSNCRSHSPVSPDDYKDPFFDPPPALGARSEPVAHSSNSVFDDTPTLDSLLESDALLNVQILSSVEGSNFYIPLSLMVEREIMMRKTAANFGIGLDRWVDSLLYREWRNAQDDISSTPEDRAFQQSDGDVTIFLNPEADCAASNHSHSLKWTPWLTTCIRAFYNTGTVRFPNDCVGSDILLALEYFGIVYTPDQLVFDTFGAYLRVKLWSEYFTHRSGLAQWVVETLMQTNSKHSHTFVTSPSLQEGDLLVGSKRADVLDGHLQLDATKYLGTPSNAVVHDFFHDEERPEGVEYPLDSLMREDFAHFVENSLPGTRVTFTLKDVQVVRSGKTVKRATLHVDFVEPPQQAPSPSQKQLKKVGERARARQATSVREQTDVVNLAPRIERSRPAAITSPRTKSRSPSPAAMFRKVGSALRKSTASAEVIQSKNSIGGSPVAEVIINKIQSSPSADHVYDKLRKERRWNKKKKEMPTRSADHVYDELDESFLVSNVPGSEKSAADKLCPSPSLSRPSDEKKMFQARADQRASSAATAPFDERQVDSSYPRAPIKSIWEGDQCSVVSGLTHPFLNDESTVRSLSLTAKHPSKPAPTSKPRTPAKSVSKATPIKAIEASGSPDKYAADTMLEPADCFLRILEDGSTLDSGTDFFQSSLGTEASNTGNPLHSEAPQCGGGDIVSSTFQYFFGKQPSNKAKKFERSKLSGRSQPLGDVDMESLAGRGKSTLSTIEGYLPDIDLQTNVETEVDVGNLPSVGDPPATLESSAAAWLRSAVNFNQFIFDDPVSADDDDEYLRLARQAEANDHETCTAPPGRGSAGNLVTDILDSLMSDNHSLLAGSVISTDVSSKGSCSTPSTRLTKAGPFIPFANSDSSSESTLADPPKADELFAPKALPSILRNGQVTAVSQKSRFPSRERLRFQPPRRNSDRAPPRAPNKTKNESRNGTPTKERHVSPLARIPALMLGRKRGKNRGDAMDDSEMTPKMHTGIKTVSDREGEEDHGREKKPSRIAGLFRNKGLVRRRSLGEGGTDQGLIDI